MLGRMQQYDNGPISCNQAVPTQATSPVDIEKELKIGIEMICEFNRKLSTLSWQARDIINAWLRDGKQY